MVEDAQLRLVTDFANYFLTGGGFGRITEARKLAASLLNEPVNPGTALVKQVDEAIEAGLVRAARAIVQDSQTTYEAYDRLVDLHDRHPALNVRSSSSILQQAYSTPIPIAYLASTLAGITLETTVYEPTAGHGALLLATDPTQVTVNELNADRAADLQAQGFQVTQWDAADYRPEQQHDVVIANPPFGAVRDEQGNRRRFVLPGSRRGTTQIDQAISFRALEAMKDTGKAVLILGGKLGEDEDLRAERYNTLESRGFFYALYQQYNVTRHISIWGDLYRKQGAGFPIDLILIAGRSPSERLLPAAAVPPVYKSFAELKELIPDERLHHSPPHLPGVRNLFPSVEASSNGRPGLIPGESAARSPGDDRQNLRAADATTDSVDDSHLDARDRGNSGGHGSPLGPGSRDSLRSADAPDALFLWNEGISSTGRMGR